MKTYLAPILLLIGIYVPAQAQYPGGVKAPMKWFTTDLNQGQQFSWVDQLEGKHLNKVPTTGNLPTTGRLLNYNPALYWDRNMEGTLMKLGEVPLSNLQIFTVYQTRDTLLERHIWCLDQNNKIELVNTTHRSADIENFEYLNFPYHQAGFPTIHHYAQAGMNQFIQKKSPTLFLGGLPPNLNLPIQSFSGLIPELIIYDRHLTVVERRKIESYLAIKYGITLRKPGAVNYLSSQGQVIWGGESYPHFHHRVAGIGREDISGLRQNKSQSSEQAFNSEGETVLFCSSADSLQKSTFLVWGDNNQFLGWQLASNGLSKKLARQWKTQFTSGEVDSLRIDLMMQTTSFFDPIETEASQWLMVDYSGKGQFLPEQTSYFLGQYEPRTKELLFKGVPFTHRHSIYSNFTIVQGEDMMVPYHLIEPNCAQEEPGELSMKIVGGTPPYTIHLDQLDENELDQKTTIHSDYMMFNTIQAGDYQLEILDAKGNRVIHHLQVGHLDGPIIDLADQYAVKDHQPTQISLNHIGSSIKWSGPNHFHSQSPSITVTHPGEYQVQVQQGECLSIKNFQVTPSDRSFIQSFQISPNPSRPGKAVEVKLKLAQEAQVTIKVYDILGRLKFTRKRVGDQYYRFVERFLDPGIYFIQAESEGQILTRRVIIN